MRAGSHGLIVLALFLGPLHHVGADDSAVKVVHRATEAAGGARLKRFRAVSWKGKGILHGPNGPIHYTDEVTMQRPDRARSIVRGDVAGMKVLIVTVINGNRAWVQFNHRTHALQKERLAEAREQRFADNVADLVDLDDPHFHLVNLGESTLAGGQAVVGVKVSHRGHRDVRLFFDKATGLLAKSEYRLKDDNDREIKQEAFFRAYKTVQGVKKPTRIEVTRDGRPYVEEEVLSYELAERLDDRPFQEP